jgi:hypothetical protein
MAKKKQQEIPGTERQTVDELDEIIGPYVQALYERQRLQQKELELKAQLDERMVQCRKKQYVYFDGEFKFTVKLEAKNKVTVRRQKIAGDEVAVG